MHPRADSVALGHIERSVTRRQCRNFAQLSPNERGLEIRHGSGCSVPKVHLRNLLFVSFQGHISACHEGISMPVFCGEQLPGTRSVAFTINTDR